MNYRFTLSHYLLGEQEISQPDGWRDAVVKLERHPEFHSLVEYFEGSFIFYGSNGTEDGGVEFIKDVLAIGINEELIITIEITENDTDWETVFTGTLDLSLKEHMPMNKIKVPIVPDDFWTKFINRFDTPVNIQDETNLDGESVDVFNSANLTLLSQKVRTNNNYVEQYGSAIAGGSDFSTGDYVQVGFTGLEIDELPKNNNLPTARNPEIPVGFWSPESDGIFSFDISISVSSYYKNITINFGGGSCELPTENYNDVSSSFNFFFQKNDETPIQLDFDDNPFVLIKRGTRFYKVISDISLVVGDQIRIYGESINDDWDDNPIPESSNYPSLIIWGIDNSQILTYTFTSVIYDFGTTACLPANEGFHYVDHGEIPQELEASRVIIAGDTTYPETESECFLLHDVGAAISDRITGQEDSFYSEYLGSSQTTARTYDEDGCGWIYVLIKGLQLRQYTLEEKPFFQSFKDWWQGANPILNLSLSYETIEYDAKVIRVEEKAHHYDSSSNSVEFDNIRDIVSTFDNELHFKKVEQGYTKWESEDVSGIDDPQTKHTYASIFSKIGTTFTNFSSFMAASLGIEITRRKTREKSADYKHDNETFIIAINPETEYGNFVPELDENFSSVTNLLNSDTRYNIRLTPKRNLTRWMNYVAMGLQSYISSSLKFVRGEGNYDTTTTINPGCGEVETELDEKADLPISGFEPLFIPELYKMTLPMGWDAYNTIRVNKRKSIGVSQTESDHTQFFIKSLEFNPFSGQAVVIAWPKVHMDIQVIDIAPELVNCVPTYRITEEGDFRITEDGQFRII